VPFLHGVRDTVVRDKARTRLYKEPGKDRRTRRRRKDENCNNGIRDRGATRQLRLRKERTTGNGIRGRSRRQQLRLESTGNVNETFKETLGLEIAKKISGSSARIRKICVRTLWRGRPPPKRNKKLHTEKEEWMKEQ
jgi:hypothetical protein